MMAEGYTRVSGHRAGRHGMLSSCVMIIALMLLALATYMLFVYNAQVANGTPLTASSVKYAGFNYVDGGFDAVAADDHLHMVSGVVSLRKNTRYVVQVKVSRVPAIRTVLFVDLYAPGYDNPEQEVNFKLGYKALPHVLSGGFSTGSVVPKRANIRFFYYGPPGLGVSNIYIAQVPIWRMMLQNVFLCLSLLSLLALAVAFARWLMIPIEGGESFGVVSTSRAAMTIGCLYAVIAVVRFVTGWLQPYWSGDEYVYKSIASGIWAYGHAGGVSSSQLLQSLNLPNLLYPYLIAPAFAFGSDFYTAIRLINALVVSTALVPVYLISRRVTGHRASLTIAAISCLLPSVNIAAYAVTEVLYFPIFLVCAWLGLRALEKPSSVVRNLLLGITVGVLFNVKLNAMVVMPAYLMSLLVVAALDRNLSSLVRRPIWIIALAATAITYFGLREILDNGNVESLGIYQSQSGGWLSKSYSAAVSDPAGLLRLISGHLTILTVPYSVCIATVALLLFEKPANLEHAARKKVLVFSSFLFLATIALSILFTLSVSSNDLGGLGRWHSRYYFMSLPLLIICGFAAPSTNSPVLAAKVVYWSVLGVLVAGFLYFLSVDKGLADPWFGSAVDSMEVQWFRLSKTLLYLGLVLTVLVAFVQIHARRRWPLLVFLLVWLLVANYGTLTVMHRAPTADSPHCGSLAYRVLAESPGRVALVAHSREDLVDTAFWLPVAPDKAIMLKAHTRHFDGGSLRDIDYVLTEDGVVVSGASSVINAGECHIYTLK